MIFRVPLYQYFMLLLVAIAWTGVGILLIKSKSILQEYEKYKGKTILLLAIPMFIFWFVCLIYAKTEIRDDRFIIHHVGMNIEINYSDILKIQELTETKENKIIKIHRFILTNDKTIDISENRFIGNSYEELIKIINNRKIKE